MRRILLSCPFLMIANLKAYRFRRLYMEEVSFLSEGSEGPESAENIEELSNVSSKSATTNDGQGLQMLRSRLKLLEHSLEDQRITSDYLREERDKAVDVNRALRRELEELRREVYIENSAIFSAERAPGRAQNYQTGISLWLYLLK